LIHFYKRCWQRQCPLIMALDKKFAVRGLLAFLSFMEIVNCCRSLLPRLFTLPHERINESFIQNKIFNLVDLSTDTQQLIGTIFGFFSLLNAIVCAFTAVYLHHLHICSLGVCTLIVKIFFLLSTHRQTSNLTIPLVLTTTTLVGLLAIVWLHYSEDNVVCNQSENEMLLRAMKKSAKSKKRSD